MSKEHSIAGGAGRDSLAGRRCKLCTVLGEATYKAKCQMCHGATGMADAGAGKAMKVKPATDPDVKKMSEARHDRGRHQRLGQDAGV